MRPEDKVCLGFITKREGKLLTILEEAKVPLEENVQIGGELVDRYACRLPQHHHDQRHLGPAQVDGGEDNANDGSETDGIGVEGGEHGHEGQSVATLHDALAAIQMGLLVQCEGSAIGHQSEHEIAHEHAQDEGARLARRYQLVGIAAEEQFVQPRPSAG